MIYPTNCGPVEILLVEDNPGDVRLTQEALKEGKIYHNLWVAKDGEVALAGLLFAVDFDFTAQHEKRGGVTVGQRQLRRFPGAEIQVP